MFKQFVVLFVIIAVSQKVFAEEEDDVIAEGPVNPEDPYDGKVGGEPCLFLPSTGRCDAYLQRYFYNPATETCELFVYGGCGGNKNRFESKDDCLKSCCERLNKRICV